MYFSCLREYFSTHAALQNMPTILPFHRILTCSVICTFIIKFMKFVT